MYYRKLRADGLKINEPLMIEDEILDQWWKRYGRDFYQYSTLGIINVASQNFSFKLQITTPK
jgi:hypothetical protein